MDSEVSSIDYGPVDGRLAGDGYWIRGHVQEVQAGADSLAGNLALRRLR